MNLLRCKLPQIFIVRFIKGMRRFLRCNPRVFLLEYLLKDAIFGITIAVIAAILRNLVDKEKGEALDTFLEKLTLLLEMSFNRFSDLNTLHVKFVGVTNDITLMQCYAIGKCDVCDRLRIRTGGNLYYIVAFIFEKFVRFDIKRFALSDCLEMSARLTGCVLDLDGYTSIGGLLGDRMMSSRYM